MRNIPYTLSPCHIVSSVQTVVEKFLNSSNRRCTIVYKKRFSCEINCTKVQTRQIGSGVGVSFKWEPPTSTPHLWFCVLFLWVVMYLVAMQRQCNSSPGKICIGNHLLDVECDVNQLTNCSSCSLCTGCRRRSGWNSEGDAWRAPKVGRCRMG